jgi:hypothetical protein
MEMERWSERSADSNRIRPFDGVGTDNRVPNEKGVWCLVGPAGACFYFIFGLLKFFGLFVIFLKIFKIANIKRFCFLVLCLNGLKYETKL